MPGYLAHALVVTPPVDYLSRYPVIGWDGLPPVGALTADHEDADYPASNLCNPATNLLWVSTSTATQYLTRTISSVDPVDYLAVARHNFAAAGITASVEGDDGGGWAELAAEVIPADDGPLLFRFDPVALTTIRLKLQPDATPPQAAVFHAGKLLTFPKGVQIPHTPITEGRDVKIMHGMAQSGEDLGAIVLTESLSTEASWRLLPADWYEEYMRPFLVAANAGRRFFWARDLANAPAEVSYSHLRATCRPAIVHQGMRRDVTLQLGGIAL